MTKIGLLLPTRESVTYGEKNGDPRPLLDLAVKAEQAGFDSVWAGDSLLAKPRPEPLTLLAGVAAITTTVQLGTAVLLTSLRNPEQLAQTTATLDAMSGGRFILGMGGGPAGSGVRVDHELVGADFDRRGSRSFEVTERVRSLWRGDAGTQMYPLTGTAGGPPIWAGGSGQRTMERAGLLADGWFPTATSAEWYASGLARVREMAEAAGRPAGAITAAAYLTVVIGEAASAERELAEHSLLYYGVPHEKVAKVQGSMAGPADKVGQWLSGFIDAGAEHLCVRIGCEDVEGQLALLAELLDEIRS